MSLPNHQWNKTMTIVGALTVTSPLMKSAFNDQKYVKVNMYIFILYL